MTETAVEPAAAAPQDDTLALTLRTWGLSGEPVSWAPVPWQPAVYVIRAANRGLADATAVQSVLDVSFADAGLSADDIVLDHPPVGAFTAVVTGMSVRVDLDGDEDLGLPDETVRWDFGGGVVVTDAGGWDHTFATVGDHRIRLEVSVAGAVYASDQTVTVPGSTETVDPPPEPEEEGYDPAAHTVDEVLAYAAEHPDEVDAIREAEEAGKARVGILDKL